MLAASLGSVLLSEPRVWFTSYAEAIALVTVPLSICAGLAGAYKLVECRHGECRRVGLYHHKGVRVCSLHHPKLPSDGRITQEHLDNL